VIHSVFSKLSLQFVPYEYSDFWCGNSDLSTYLTQKSWTEGRRQRRGSAPFIVDERTFKFLGCWVQATIREMSIVGNQRSEDPNKIKINWKTFLYKEKLWIPWQPVRLSTSGHDKGGRIVGLPYGSLSFHSSSR
jgi:hypothetical protein